MTKSCAFTGHRDLVNLDVNLLDSVVKNLIISGCKRFLCGMAVGFDLAAAESVIALKKKYPEIELVACVPCEGQSLFYSHTDKKRYERILKNCSEISVLSENYYEGCMLARDRYMVDNCDVVVSYLRKKSGGTFYTVNYAKSHGKKIIEL